MRARTIAVLGTLGLLAACGEAEVASAPDVPRTVRTVEATLAAPTRVRTFPAVLEPPEITPLAFDVGGRLRDLDLRIGQRVRAGDVIATVEAADAELRLAQAEAQLQEARIAADNARTEADRQVTLFRRDVASEAARDAAVTGAEQAEARVAQAARNVELVREAVTDTALRSPIDAVVNSIEVQAFGTVQAGQPVATLYRDEGLQATVLVSYDVVSTLSLGDEVVVRPTDGAPEPLPATIAEIARRAPAVSSFPVVVTLAEAREDLRSGMAVEVVLELPVPSAERGIPLPLSALALQRSADLEATPRRADVFVVERDGDAMAVMPRTVAIGAVVDDRAFVVDGLEPGTRVVTAGVPFLHEGQAVALEAGTRPVEGTETGRSVPSSGPNGSRVPPDPVAVQLDPVTATPEPETRAAEIVEPDPGPTPSATEPSVSMEPAADAGAAAIGDVRRNPTKADALKAPGEPVPAALAEPLTELAPDRATVVAAAQERLAELGYDVGPVTGEANPRTRLVVGRFQADEGLDVSGDLTEVTLARLEPDDGPRGDHSPEAPRVDPPLGTAALQRLLGELGYDPGPADGIMGPSTRAAIRAFQDAEGLRPTGEIGGATSEALREAGGN